MQMSKGSGQERREEARHSDVFYFYPKITFSEFSTVKSAVLGCSESCLKFLSPQNRQQ